MAVRADILTSTRGMSRGAWLQARRNGIGGSDAAAIAGINPWKSPIAVWLDKTGQAPEEDSQSQLAWLGNEMEAVVAKWFQQEHTQFIVRRRNAILRHPQYPFMLANVDREVKDPEKGWGLLEIKTTSPFNRGFWDGEKAPDQYVIQCQHYMAVTGAKWCWLAVLIFGVGFKEKLVLRDDELISGLIKLESGFWELVEKRVPPEIDGSEVTSEILSRLYPDSKPDTIVYLTDIAQPLIDQYDQADADEKAAAFRKEEAINKLKIILGPNEIGILGERKVRWPSIISERFDTKKLKKDRPDIYAQYVTQNSYRRFEIR